MIHSIKMIIYSHNIIGFAIKIGCDWYINNNFHFMEILLLYIFTVFLCESFLLFQYYNNRHGNRMNFLSSILFLIFFLASFFCCQRHKQSCGLCEKYWMRFLWSGGSELLFIVIKFKRLNLFCRKSKVHKIYEF